MKYYHLCAAAAGALVLFGASVRADPPLDTNLLSNPGFEDASPNGWVGPYFRNAPGHSGVYCFGGPQLMQTFHVILQDLDLAALGGDSVRLATGGYRVSYGGYQTGYLQSTGRISTDEYAADGRPNGEHSLPAENSPDWVLRQDSFRLRHGTEKLRYELTIRRPEPVEWNRVRLDDAYLKIGEYGIWTWDQCSEHYAGNGPWTVSDVISVGNDATGGVGVSNGATWTTNSLVLLGNDSSGSGTVNLSGGTWDAGHVNVGSLGSGEVNVNTGGLWTTDSAVVLGYYVKGSGTVNLSGGTWNATEVYVGWGSADEAFVSTGEVNVNTGGLWTTDGLVYLGLDLKGSGTVNLSGGTWDASGSVQVGVEGTGEVNVNAGGTMNLAGDLSLGSQGTLTLDGGRLNLGSGGVADISGALIVTDVGGTIDLNNAQLSHSVEALDLNGGRIVGSGEILTPSAGLMLGSAELPGSITGHSPTERLVLYGDLSGSGSVTNAAVYGNVNIGSSAGEMTFKEVVFDAGTTIEMEIAGLALEEFDRLTFGPRVDLSHATLEVIIVGSFEAGVGDSFNLFDAVGGADLAVTLGVAAIQLPEMWVLNTNTGVVTLVPDPSSLGLLALGSAGVLVRRCRKADRAKADAIPATA